MPNTLGELLKEKRAEHGMTQKELAMKAGISVVHVYSMEGGSRQPSVKLARVLGEILDFDWVLCFPKTG